jgi:glutamate synthase (NADPH/NADH) large chain/glutamate synthase (ferredoxin)
MGFSTAPLIATGCVMMRACHLNTCPVGIATQDPVLRARFAGTPEHVVNFFFYVAEEARAIMAELGIPRFEDLIGRVDLLEADDAIDHWKARGIDLSNLLLAPDVPAGTPLHRTRAQDSPLDSALDWELIGLAEEAIQHGTPVSAELQVRNVHRAVGGLLSHSITVARGAEGLPEGTIRFVLRGSAGQSFGAWLAPGVELTLWGDANDYTGKGLSGGTIAIRPPEGSTFAAEENVIVGNTVLYGATKGKAFFRGLAGERFAVRNSGADAVIEGVGDHGCEYMTGGHVVVLGRTGRNFAAGMSGGIAYVLDDDGGFAARCNHELVDLEVVDDGDAAIVWALVEEHLERTGSPVASRVLAEFEQLRPRFVKVMPRDYRAALEALAAGNGQIDYPDDHAVSSGGEGFVTAEVESGSAG